jgi:thiamine kinase-like enzyme
VGGRRLDELDAVLSELGSRLGPPAAAPEPLEGGITNRNYRVAFADQDAVIRLAGKDTSLLGIDRRAERLANQAASELGIAPRVLAGGEDWLLTEYVAGTPCDAGTVRTVLEPIGRALGAFHRAEVRLPIRFWVPELLDTYAHVVGERGGRLPAAYGQARAVAARIAELVPLTDPVPCHNDLLPANVLRVGSADTVMLVDWEYAGMGHGLFDLGNLAVNAQLAEAEEGRLLTAYLGRPPSDAELARLRLMRVMSDAREAAWGVVQGVISELDFDFAAYAARHFQRLDAAARDPRLQEWLDAATA